MSKKIEKPLKRMRVQFDIVYGGTSVKKDGSSETRPEMNLTVRQLLDNFSRTGDPGAPTKPEMYFEHEVPSFDDVMDVQDYKNSLNKQLENVEKFIDETRAAEAEAEAAAGVEVGGTGDEEYR